ncbi:hypothetical protein [Burkholderia ubonensis]|uniref:hypothetical protein n=1 Tax=Burkholderia ubonensis TaxID=101571 RepID=UPI000ABCF434|nr:hypothetical protein [Burkholderia ubonensis]
MSVDLEILIARFRWPAASTKLWAMQELADLLLAPEFQVRVTEQLLNELARCRLEAEVVEVLCIFWIAFKQGYTPPSMLASQVRKPSLLAELLLADMEQDLNCEHNPPLELAPTAFEIPERFKKIHELGIPGIYLTVLRSLEKRTRLPFVAQCAFEWANTDNAYPEAPLQGDVGHFLRSLGPGVTGTFSNRATLRMQSAYQRTLDVARLHWGMPEITALEKAKAVLPIDPTLAFLRPRRPSWLLLPGKDVATGAAEMETYVRGLIKSAEATQAGAVLLSFASPAYVDSREIVELTVVRWRRWGTSDFDTNALANRFDERQKRWGYGACFTDLWGCVSYVPQLHLDDIRDEESNAAPMAAVFGFDRYGYLHGDLHPSRLYYPVVTDVEGNVTVEPNGGELDISTPNGKLGKLYYWNMGWHPVHPLGSSAFCATALFGEADAITASFNPAADSHFYLWTIRRMKRAYDYEPFEADEPLHGIVIVTGAPI